MKRVGMIAAGVCCGVSVWASDIDFTVAEGYQTGHPRWDRGEGRYWKGAVNDYLLDAEKGTLTLPSDVGYRRLVFQEPLPGGKSRYMVSVEFSFDRTPVSLSRQQQVLSVEFTEKEQDGDRVAIQLERQKDAASDKYRLSFWENSGSPKGTGQQGGWATEADWGFADGADLLSDALRFELSLIRGANAGSWTASATLSNLETGKLVQIPSELIGTFDLSEEYWAGPLYAVINSCARDGESQTSNRVIKKFSVNCE